MFNVITIDGTASSGKSTVGLLFAEKIGSQFVDSGLIYRVGVLLAKRNNVEITDGEKCAKLLVDQDIEFKMLNKVVRIFLSKEDVTDLLKTPEVDKLVPILAAHREVRVVTKGVQRKIGSAQNTVMAGRDIGSEIFPDAKLKFFITASVEARAKRRYDQQVKDYPEIKLEDIEKEISERDVRDSTRRASPMRIPENAIVVDTSEMTIDEVVTELYKCYNGHPL